MTGRGSHVRGLQYPRRREWSDPRTSDRGIPYSATSMRAAR